MSALALKHLVRNSKNLVFNPPMYAPGTSSMFPVGAKVTGTNDMYWWGGNATICNWPFGVVVWGLHHITIWKIGPKDALSFNFSGCLMALYSLGGEWHAAHIHMGDRNDTHPEWINYMANHPGITQLVMFRPDYKAYDAVLRHYQDKGGKASMLHIVGMITLEKECYTLYLEGLDRVDAKFRLVAYKLHTPGAQRASYATILATPTKATWDGFFDAFDLNPVNYLDDFADEDWTPIPQGLQLVAPEDVTGTSCCL